MRSSSRDSWIVWSLSKRTSMKQRPAWLNSSTVVSTTMVAFGRHFHVVWRSWNATERGVRLQLGNEVEEFGGWLLKYGMDNIIVVPFNSRPTQSKHTSTIVLLFCSPKLHHRPFPFRRWAINLSRISLYKIPLDPPFVEIIPPLTITFSTKCNTLDDLAGWTSSWAARYHYMGRSIEWSTLLFCHHFLSCRNDWPLYLSRRISPSHCSTLRNQMTWKFWLRMWIPSSTLLGP